MTDPSSSPIFELNSSGVQARAQLRGGQFVVLMFTAAVLGGLGSVAGAVVGGLMVGVVQSFSAMLLPLQLQNLVLFVVFIAILAWRPQGLLGAQA